MGGILASLQDFARSGMGNPYEKRHMKRRILLVEDNDDARRFPD